MTLCTIIWNTMIMWCSKDKQWIHYLLNPYHSVVVLMLCRLLYIGGRVITMTGHHCGQHTWDRVFTRSILTPAEYSFLRILKAFNRQQIHTLLQLSNTRCIKYKRGYEVYIYSLVVRGTKRNITSLFFHYGVLKLLSKWQLTTHSIP